MAFSKVETAVVDVGQGQCTFAVVYDDSSPAKVVHTLLFDCGTHRDNHGEIAINIQKMVAILQSMDNPKIDLLVFSHSDSDHINLMYPLLDTYGKTATKPLSIPNVWYGGDRAFYTKTAGNILTTLETYYGSVLTSPKWNQSQFDRSTSTFIDPPMWASTDGSVKVYMLVGNVVDDDVAFGTGGPKKNRVSIVSALFHGNQTMVICGDATSRTMAWVNYYFYNDSGDYFIQFSRNRMLTLPHHGSRATAGLDEVSKAANDRAVGIVKSFAYVNKANTLTVSAFAEYGHPSLALSNYFAPYLLTTPVLKDARLTSNSHFSVFNVDVALTTTSHVSVLQDYHTLGTSSNVFTTFYNGSTAGFSYQLSLTTSTVTDPPTFSLTPQPSVNQHACWVYITYPSGTVDVMGVENLAATAPFTSAATVSTSAPAAAPPPVTSNLLRGKSPVVLPIVSGSRSPVSSTSPRMSSRWRSFR